MTATSADTAQDWHEIYDVLVCYADAVDRRRYDLLERCFTDDATAQYAGTDVDPGAKAIVEFIRRALTSKVSTHFVSNVNINIDGDVATSDSVTIACHVQGVDGASTLLIRSVRYLDRLERRGSRWLIARRMHIPSWACEVPGALYTTPTHATPDDSH
jgi:ketosteroid isomerase-like protein